MQITRIVVSAFHRCVTHRDQLHDLWYLATEGSWDRLGFLLAILAHLLTFSTVDVQDTLAGYNTNYKLSIQTQSHRGTHDLTGEHQNHSKIAIVSSIESPSKIVTIQCFIYRLTN